MKQILKPGNGNEVCTYILYVFPVIVLWNHHSVGWVNLHLLFLL